MYLRKTERKNQDGSVVRYYQLAHNVRDPKTGNAVAKVIHSFGRADELDEDTLKRLCASLARVVGLEVHELSRPCEEPKDVLGAGVQQVRTRNYGVVLAVQTLWERLGIGRALQNVVKAEGCRVPYEQALLAIVTSR
jgi:hypothetical protein